MKPTIAINTLNAIKEQMESDQGARYRGFLAQTMPAMGDAYSTDTFPFRSHMGASMIGRDCGLEIWFGFHWAFEERHTDRMIRLFNRGHLEEARFLAMLLAIGCDVYQQDANGNQYRISHAGGHFGGSGDGIVVNCPDLAPGQAALCEFKTYNVKSFAKLKKQGVKVAKPEHYSQMQTYMVKMGFAAALYMAICKDNDELYAEIVYYDSVQANLMLDRGEALAFMDYEEAKKQRVSKSPSFFYCKSFCSYYYICNYNDAPAQNCRTCNNVQVCPDGTWRCVKYNKTLSKQEQYDGCADYMRMF